MPILQSAKESPAGQPLAVKNKMLLVHLVVGVLLIFLIFLVWPSSDFPASDKSIWQAVFLTNNQVYFGHLLNYSKSNLVLTNIFYLRAAEPLQQGSAPQPALSLVKLGAELHGPEDTMYIPKDKIMFWENMKKDSQVVQAINNFLASQPKR